jgi:hypothetical protein
MSMSKIALAIPLALGIACSTSGAQSRDGTTGSWQRTPSSAQASSQPADPGASSEQAADPGASHEDLSVQPTAGTDTSSGSSGTGSSDTQGSAGSSDSSAQGGQMGSGGSSETMGSEKEQGGSAQGSAGSSDQAQQGAGNMGAHAGDLAVSGKITKISKDEISIKPKSGKAKTLKLSDSTSVMVNGKDAKWSQLKKGQSVRASYENAGGEDTAIRVETGAKRHGRKHGASGGSGSSSPESSGGSSSDTGSQHEAH